VDDCRSFETLEEAEEHCNALQVHCGGITKTAYGDQEAISLGVGLYEVRSGPGIEQQTGDATWIKQEGCDSGFQGGGVLPVDHQDEEDEEEETAEPDEDQGEDQWQYEEEDRRWDDSMEQVGDAYRGAFVQIFWLAALLGLLAGGVYFSYKRGDQITIDYVDKAREKVEKFMRERGPRNEGAYESL